MQKDSLTVQPPSVVKLPQVGRRVRFRQSSQHLEPLPCYQWIFRLNRIFQVEPDGDGLAPGLLTDLDLIDPQVQTRASTGGASCVSDVPRHLECLTAEQCDLRCFKLLSAEKPLMILVVEATEERPHQ